MATERRSVDPWQATLVTAEHGNADSAAAVLVLHSEEGPDSVSALCGGLAEDSYVVAPCHPGFGGEPRVRGAERPRDLAYLYLDLLDQLSLDACALVGSSLGAWIALEMAAMQPQRFGCLVAIGPVGLRFGGPTEQTYAELLVASADALRQLLYDDPARDPRITRTTPEDTARAMRDKESFTHYVWEPYLHEPTLRQLLPRVRMPALILAGSGDGVVAADHYTTLAAELPAAELVRVEHAGHYPEIEQPTRTTELAGQFIAKHRGDRSRTIGGRDGQR